MSKEYYNNYPEGFLEPFKEKVTFRLVGIRADPDNPGSYLMPSVTSIPPSSTVIYNDQEVHLALISSFDTNGNMIPDDRSMMLGQFNSGEITLDPKKPKHVAMFNYINHCHHNKSSKYTFPGAKHVVEKVDHEALAAKESNLLDLKRAALMTISTINDDAIASIAAFLLEKEPEDSPLSAKVRRANLDKIADKYPEKVIDVCKKLGIHLVSVPGSKQEAKQVELDIDPFIKSKVEGLLDAKVISKINARKEFTIKETGESIFQWSDGPGSPIDKFIVAISEDEELLSTIEDL